MTTLRLPGPTQLRIALALLTLAVPARAAETDQYYSWFVRVPDGTAAIDRYVNDGFARALDEVNRSGHTDRPCGEVAKRLMGEQWRAAVWHVIGATRDWGYPFRPATRTEFEERYSPVSLYRYFGLLPFGIFVPIDPTVYAAGIYFGPDKLGHFFDNGQRYWDEYQTARARGASVDEAERAAVMVGVAQEDGILGGIVTSTFGYGDLEANFQGMQLIRSMCEGDEPSLRRGEDGQWALREPFAIRRWVNPCWDESFYPNAYEGLTAEGVKRALKGYCPLRHRPDIAALRARYRALGCHSRSVQILDELIEKGSVPDPRPFTLESACGDPPARPRPAQIAAPSGSAQGR